MCYLIVIGCLLILKLSNWLSVITCTDNFGQILVYSIAVHARNQLYRKVYIYLYCPKAKTFIQPMLANADQYQLTIFAHYDQCRPRLECVQTDIRTLTSRHWWQMRGGGRKEAVNWRTGRKYLGREVVICTVHIVCTCRWSAGQCAVFTHPRIQRSPYFSIQLDEL